MDALARPEEPRFSPPIDDVVGGSWEDGGRGPAFVARRVFPLSDALGPARLGDFLHASPRCLGLLTPAAGEFLPGAATFLDVETTGLCGGTGTVAFLVGLARFVPAGLEVSQLFLPDYGAEPALLALLARMVPPGAALVTFNGRAFDWPILETRFVLSRMRAPAVGPHLDLLPAARRLWRRRLGECSLAALEAGILGVGRHGDVPGYLIPSLYFDYLRRRDASSLGAVFDHNRRDLLSMVALGALMAARLAEPLAPPPPPDDLLSLGRIFERAGDVDRGLACYEAARRSGSAGPVAALANQRAAALHKRAGRHDDAAALWRAALAGDSGTLLPYVELAKHLEHRRGDFHAARDVVVAALARLEAWTIGRPEAGVTAARAALRHRLSRLNRRCGGPAPGAAPPPAHRARRGGGVV